MKNAGLGEPHVIDGGTEALRVEEPPQDHTVGPAAEAGLESTSLPIPLRSCLATVTLSLLAPRPSGI